MKVLDLFSGTGSVAKVFRSLGYTVTTLDSDMEADIKTDIMKWRYKDLPRGSFDVIWASPPCTEYSLAKTTGVRRIEEANEIVKRTLKNNLIFQSDYLDFREPTNWILEKAGFHDWVTIRRCRLL